MRLDALSSQLNDVVSNSSTRVLRSHVRLITLIVVVGGDVYKDRVVGELSKLDSVLCSHVRLITLIVVVGDVYKDHVVGELSKLDSVLYSHVRMITLMVVVGGVYKDHVDELSITE